MPQSYSGWSLDKLKKERQKLDKAIEVAEKRDKKATLAKMAAIAKQNGFSLHELMGDPAVSPLKELKIKEPKNRTAQKSVKPRGKVPPKYVNPDDQSQTWTGRGRQPLWVKAQIEKGLAISELEIEKALP